MKLISHIVMLSAITLTITYVNSVSTIKLRDKSDVKLTNNCNRKVIDDKLNDQFLLENRKVNVRSDVRTKRKKAKFKLSKQLADAKKKCWNVQLMSSRIVNGVTAKENTTITWIVELYLKMNWMFQKTTRQCGGALISNQFVLTAAHCLFDDTAQRLKPEDLLVRLGTHNLSSNNYVKRKIVKIFMHPNYSEDKCCDIGVLKLKYKVKYSDVLSPVCVPNLTTPTFWDKLKDGEAVLIAGFGSASAGSLPDDSPYNLQKGYSSIVKPQVCKSLYKNYNLSTIICIQNKHKGGATPCKGDSGSAVVPLLFLPKKNSIVFPVVIGVVAWGDPKCRGPYGLTKVESFINWINKCTLN